MITDLKQALGNTFLLHVNSKPVQTPRSFFDKDEDGNDVGEERRWTEETVTGVLLTGLLNPKQATPVEVQIRTTQMSSVVPNAPTYGDILEAFLENKADFIAGNKLFSLQTMQMPRVNRKGDKAGIANSFVPTLIGFEVVDAKEDDIKYIENLKSLRNENTVEANLAESAVS